MNFYTNVIQWGNNLLVRGVENDKRISKRVRDEPTLFALVNKPTKYRTLDNKYVEPQKFLSINDAKDWLKQYEGQSDLIYGNTQFNYAYIGDLFNGDVPWDKDKILIVTIDIEVACDNGFPSVAEAPEEMLSITIKNHQSKQIVVFGTGEFTTERKDVHYVKCEDEDELRFFCFSLLF